MAGDRPSRHLGPTPTPQKAWLVETWRVGWWALRSTRRVALDAAQSIFVRQPPSL